MSKFFRGFGLIELMVALAISSLLIIGAVTVYSESRKTYSINETTARLQENARYIFSIMEPDIQLAGYYGFSNAPDDFKYIQGGSTAVVTPASSMQTASPTVPGLGTTHLCGNNFAVNLLATVQGSENAYGLGCAAQGGGALAATDTLTVRRAATTVAAGPVAGRMEMLVTRLNSANQFVFADGALPATPVVTPNLVQVRDLIINTYYISQNSTGRPGLPALRRKFLVNGPDFADEEIMPGVEDLQVQFGIDTGDYDGDGLIDPGLDEDANGIPDAPNGIATRYVNPNFLNLNRFQVVSVRIWLLLRAENIETGFTNNGPYQYAGKNVVPADNFRRVLVSRTIQLRNARTL